MLFGQVMLDDFDAILNPYVSYSGNVLQGPQQNCCTASPPYNFNLNGDTTKYASVQQGQTSVFSTTPGHALTSFSFYLGSPDPYNTISFYNGVTQLASFSGDAIWGGAGGASQGQRDWGYRIYYNFGGAQVTSITFDSTPQNAFEFDGLAGTAVPEPATWGLMIAGFGGIGAVLRRRRQTLVAA